MKRTLILIPAFLLLMNGAAFAQFPSRTRSPNPAVPPALDTTKADSKDQERFDLNFPEGGTPQMLVDAINKKLKTPINAIIPLESQSDLIPPFSIKQVTVEELFATLEAASQKTVRYVTGTTIDVNGGKRDQYQPQSVASGFRRQVPGGAWFYYNTELPDFRQLPERICRFYLLEPYLKERKVEDITTALETGWKMLGKQAPKLSFHPETKLLIAVGEPDQLQLIDQALMQLAPVAARSEMSPKAGDASSGTVPDSGKKR